ncbi:DUF6549 family protein [Chitinophaga tropicalis]|uniref:Uncharacterized protein n=1 Tax=Chitinophaga tropicalis TaxID=2683588 RepID=A0A7K1UAI9_9BACT|nr:DUF6549 family protein [Chitinophaga tropicalis]MVT11389.1 hypothetical protein [Chitinophaga tropicalis]
MKINVWTTLFAVVAIFFVFLQVKSYRQETYYKGIIAAKDDTVRTWQDEAGRWRAEATSTQVANKDLQEFFHMEAEQIRKDFNLKLKNVTGYLRANLQTSGTVTIKPDSGTTVIVRNPSGSDTAHFRYRDHWSKFDATLLNNKLTLDYQTRDSVAFAMSRKRRSLFGPKRAVLEGISYNPNSTIAGITGIEIKAPNYRWSIGPCAAYGWMGNRWSLFTGVSVQYSLIKF